MNYCSFDSGWYGVCGCDLAVVTCRSIEDRYVYEYVQCDFDLLSCKFIRPEGATEGSERREVA